MEGKKAKKLEMKFEGDQLVIFSDFNQDGEKSLELKVNLSEGFQELLQRGEKLAGVKLVAFEFGLSGIKLKLDTDQDGESVLELDLNFAEALDEIGLGK